MLFPKADIRRAFDEDEFFPVFQSQVELRTCQLVGFEVLARWQHKTLGVVGPDKFVPAVEKCGLIDRLTQTILKKAFQSPVLEKDEALTLAVNISPRQLLGLKLAERLMALAASEGCFALNRLIVEITESALMDDLERAQTAARDLKALKCKLWLDDFGTGYSSLKHLHALPFDELKVDRNFVHFHDGKTGKPEDCGGCGGAGAEPWANHGGRRCGDAGASQHAALAGLRSGAGMAFWQARHGRGTA